MSKTIKVAEILNLAISDSEKVKLIAAIKDEVKTIKKSFKDFTPIQKVGVITGSVAALGITAIAVHKTKNYFTRNNSKQKELGVLDARRA